MTWLVTTLNPSIVPTFGSGFNGHGDGALLSPLVLALSSTFCDETSTLRSGLLVRQHLAAVLLQDVLAQSTIDAVTLTHVDSLTYTSLQSEQGHTCSRSLSEGTDFYVWREKQPDLALVEVRRGEAARDPDVRDVLRGGGGVLLDGLQVGEERREDVDGVTLELRGGERQDDEGGQHQHQTAVLVVRRVLRGSHRTALR